MSSSTSDQIRVLLVDDEPAILRSLERILLEHELVVETSSCVAEAEVFLNRCQFDVVLCDHNMPGKTGLEFLTELKQENPDLIAMMLSGQVSGLPVAEDWASEIGVQTIFSKPFDATMIATKIKEAYCQNCVQESASNT